MHIQCLCILLLLSISSLFPQVRDREYAVVKDVKKEKKYDPYSKVKDVKKKKPYDPYSHPKDEEDEDSQGGSTWVISVHF